MQNSRVPPWRLWKPGWWSRGRKRWPDCFPTSPVQRFAWIKYPNIGYRLGSWKNILSSAYQNAWPGLTDWRNQEDAPTICRCHFIRITGCVMWTLRLEESTGWTNLVDCLHLAPLQPMLFASLGHAGYSSIMLLSTWAAQDTCTALAWLSIAGATSNSNIVSGGPMIRSWLWPALGTENCQLCFYLL